MSGVTITRQEQLTVAFRINSTRATRNSTWLRLVKLFPVPLMLLILCAKPFYCTNTYRKGKPVENVKVQTKAITTLGECSAL